MRKLSNEKMQALEESINKTQEEISDFAMDNKVSYDEALLILSGKATLEDVNKVFLNESVEMPDDVICNESIIKEMLEACEELAKKLSGEK